MGQLSSTLEEFQDISQEYYKKIMEILEDKYCWKCPQRSTSGKIWCREVDAWIRLMSIMEMGINNSLDAKSYSEKEIESINLNLLQKKSNKLQNPKILILKADKNYGSIKGGNVEIKKNDLLLVSENLQKARQGDLVLLSEICPLTSCSPFKLDFTNFPYKIDRIKKIIIKDRIRYMENGDGIFIPVVLLNGRVIKVISPENPLYTDFNDFFSL